MADMPEPHSRRDNGPGRLELICGCMFSGKTERLIACLAAAEGEGRPVKGFKHAADRRYSYRDLVSHSRLHFAAEPVPDAAAILADVEDAQVVGIDEAQFFGEDLVEACRRLRAEGRRVIVAGLDRNCWGEPFHPVPDLAAVADEVIRTEAVCATCGGRATYTCRYVAVEPGKPMVGGPEAYEPRCAHCFKPPVVIGTIGIDEHQSG